MTKKKINDGNATKNVFKECKERSIINPYFEQNIDSEVCYRATHRSDIFLSTTQKKLAH